jgi:3',5'-cyclic AMP phosphodiesterase CpdA
MSLMIALALLPAYCIHVQTTPPPAGATPKEVAVSGASVLIGAGDIGDCARTGAARTALLVDSILKGDSVAKVEDAVFTSGDHAYPVGSKQNFIDCFTPTWGDSLKSIMKKIHPAPGNHEHETARATPYYLYFGDRAGDPTKGYYSWEIGTWHAIAINSALITESQFTAADRKAQEDWLAADLKSHTKKCTLVYWHHPRFSSGYHGDDPRLATIWQILYDGDADLVINGHDHDYERFVPQTPAGVFDTLRGITEIVAGTGGGVLRGFRDTPSANSVSRVQGYYGVLKLTLGAGEFRWGFIDTTGRLWDASGGRCH